MGNELIFRVVLYLVYWGNWISSLESFSPPWEWSQSTRSSTGLMPTSCARDAWTKTHIHSACVRAWGSTQAFWILAPDARDNAEVTWRCAEGDLPAVLVESPGSPFLLWGRAAPAPLVGPGHLCLLSHLWPLRDQWLRYCHCFRGFLKQPDTIAWGSPSLIPPTFIQTQPQSAHTQLRKGPWETVPNTATEAPWRGVSLHGTLKTALETLKTPKPVILIKQDLDEKKNCAEDWSSKHHL